MSRLGRKPIPVPTGVEISVQDSTVVVKGPKGELRRDIPEVFELQIESKLAVLAVREGAEDSLGLQGLMRRLIANMVEGVSQGYTKALEIQGVGYRGSLQGRKAVFALGFSSPKELNIPEGIELNVDDGVNVIVSGPDKQQVGDFAARIRALAPAEPYKGKGVRYKGEQIKRKVGKTVA